MWPWEAGAGGASSLFPFTSSVRLGLGTALCGLALSSGSVRPFYCWGGAAAWQDSSEGEHTYCTFMVSSPALQKAGSFTLALG